MPGSKISTRQNLKSMMRVFIGLIFAVALYQLAKSYATSDCAQLQTDIRRGGSVALQKIALVSSLLALAGAPAAVVAVFLGIFIGPIAGAPMSSLAIAVGAGFWWLIGHFCLPHGLMPVPLDNYVEERPWYGNLMRQNAKSAFHWTVRNGFVAPIPFAVLGLVVGAKIRHMNFLSFITGVFISSIALLMGYSLAGASIGCAVINHAQGYDFGQYKSLMLLSCVILTLLSKIQAIVEERVNGV